MKELLDELQKRINTLIALHFYHKVDGVIQKMADASYSVYLKEIKNLTDSVELKFTNGMDNAGKSDFTVSVPPTAVCKKENETAWSIEYKSGEAMLFIRLFFTDSTLLPAKTTDIERPTISEIRNDQGTLEKLEIATPDNGVSIDFLTNVKSVLSQVLSKWSKFTLSSPDKSDEENNIVYEFQDVETVTLPGNTFFEIIASSPQGVAHLEMSTSLTLHVKNAEITFLLDNFPNTIKKHQ